MQEFNSAWQPSASLELLHLRANILARIRQFFAKKHILEVETPLLSQATVTDKYLHSFQTEYYFANPHHKKTLYLQTSPEFAMKRLLAADSGPIYQICKAFRNQGESGRVHNPEFTMLEWYRPGFNHHDLMDEMEELLATLLDYKSAQRFTYFELFKNFLNIDPHHASLDALKLAAQHCGITTDNLCSQQLGFRQGAVKMSNRNVYEIHEDCEPSSNAAENSSAKSVSTMERDDWLNLLMTHCIEPKLPDYPVFIYDFPASQAALAKIRPGNPPLAERFEVYVQGLELANGFHELNASQEQRQRFMNDLTQREKMGYAAVPIDEHLLAALAHGFPDCAGVALGVDRLIMLAAKKTTINEVIAFPLGNA